MEENLQTLYFVICRGVCVCICGTEDVVHQTQALCLNVTLSFIIIFISVDLFIVLPKSQTIIKFTFIFFAGKQGYISPSQMHFCPYTALVRFSTFTVRFYSNSTLPSDHCLCSLYSLFILSWKCTHSLTSCFIFSSCRSFAVIKVSKVQKHTW